MVWIEFELLIINSPFVKNNKGVRSFAVPLIGSKLTEGLQHLILTTRVKIEETKILKYF